MSHMERIPFPKRWLFLSLLPFCAAVILGSCSTPATSTNVATRPPASQPEPTSTARAPCQTRQLLFVVGQLTSNLGNAGLEFSFKNQSRVSCTLFGYPKLQLLDAQHKPLRVQITRSTSGYLYRTRDPQVISLHPGEKADFAITWGNLGCGDTSPTYATPTAFLLVTLPLNKASFLVATRLCAYGNQVSVSPLEPSQILGVFL
jgi:Protein of unknown function (DUF4232)